MRFSLAFALVPLAIAIPSYLFGEYFTQSPNDGYHRYADLHWMVLSSLVNAPLLALAAYISWPLFGYQPGNLFYKSFIGNAFFGLLLPETAIFSTAYVAGFTLMGLGYFGISLRDSVMFIQFVLMSILIWSSYLFLMFAGGIVGLVFGRLKELRRSAG